MMLRVFLVLFSLFSLSSCNKKAPSSGKNCFNANSIIAARQSLFTPVPQAEIETRNSTILKYSGPLEQKTNMMGIIYDAILNAKDNQEMIPIDFRYYATYSQDIPNIIFSNFTKKKDLNLFLLTSSEYTQGIFAVINFSSDEVTFIPAKKLKDFSTTKIKKKLLNSELVFNMSNSTFVQSEKNPTEILNLNLPENAGIPNRITNFKMTHKQKTSYIIDNSKNIQVSLMYASKEQNILKLNWSMPLFSIENTNFFGGLEIKRANIDVYNNQRSILNPPLASKGLNANINCITDRNMYPANIYKN